VRRAKTLRKLRLMGLSRLDRLRTFTVSQLHTNSRKAAVSYCLIESVALFHQFVRSLYISTSLGALSANGKSVTLAQNFVDERQAILFAANWFQNSKNNPKPVKVSTYFNEPPWQYPKHILNLSNHLVMSNAPAITAGSHASTRSWRRLSKSATLLRIVMGNCASKPSSKYINTL